jgi:30S ribosomal protein S31
LIFPDQKLHALVQTFQKSFSKIIFRRSIQMGRGDRKTQKGKRAVRSYGNSRPHKIAAKAGAVVKKTAAAKPAVKKVAPAVKKAPAKKSV